MDHKPTIGLGPLIRLTDSTWNMDMGAFSHLNSHSSNLSTCLYPSVRVGDGKTIPVTNTGHSILPTLSRHLYLHNVLVTPNIIKNLISVPQFTRDNKCTVEFDEFGFSVKDFLTRHILLRCDSSGDLYPITKPSHIPSALLSVSPNMWHQRLGHPSAKVLRSLISRNVISCNKEKSSHICHACQLGKHVKLPFVSSDTRVSSCFDIIHSDIWTYPVPTFRLHFGLKSSAHIEPQHTPTTVSPSHIEPIPTVASSSHLKQAHKHRKTKRKATEISHSSGPIPLVADETVYKEREDIMERAATSAASLDAKQDNGNIIRTQSMATLNEHIPQGTGSGSGPKRQDTILEDRHAQTRFERLSKQSNDPPLSRVNTLESGEDSMKLNELMELYIRLSERVLSLKNIKTAQDLEITNLKKRVKKLEKKKKSRISQLKRRLFKVRIESFAEKSLGDQEDASKQGRNEIDQDEEILCTAEPSTPPTTTTLIEDEDLTIAQTLMKMRSVKSKEKSKEKGVSSTRGVIMKEASETATRPTVPPQQQLDPKDKGKGKMVEQEKPLKKKDQNKFDEELAQRLSAQLHAELEEEERLAKQEEEDANIAECDDVQAMMDADYELAARLQAEEQGELTIEERSRLFMELMDKRKKHFAKLRAEEQRRKPPTKTQKRN
ncbi:retrotransposon protein, putative, unclassified [Tanacetum coccineum]